MDVDELCPLPDPTGLPAVITPAQAALHGIGRHALAHRVSRGAWRRILRGVYLTRPTAPAEGERALAAVRYAGDCAMVSGPAALRLYGLRSSPRATEILVLVPAGNASRSSGFVRVRRTPRMPELSDSVHGVPAAPVGRAVVDTCLAIRDLDQVRAVVAESVQQGLCAPGELVREVEAAARRGSALVRRALGEVGLGARSAPECRIGVLLRRGRLPAFEQNIDLRGDDGSWLGCGDVVWRRLRAILEVDSREYHFDAASWRRTLERHNRLEEHGFAVLHVPPSLLRDRPDDVVRQVRAWLGRRAADLCLPLYG